jgi:hypothetical protein
MISDDIELSQLMFSLASGHPSLEALTQNLSITTLRYVPEGLDIKDESARAKYLNDLNETLLNDLQSGGEVFLSNAMVGEKYCLRACIVNFRTSEADIYKTVEIIAREGNKVHHRLKNEQSTTAW